MLGNIHFVVKRYFFLAGVFNRHFNSENTPILNDVDLVYSGIEKESLKLVLHTGLVLPFKRVIKLGIYKIKNRPGGMDNTDNPAEIKIPEVGKIIVFTDYVNMKKSA